MGSQIRIPLKDESTTQKFTTQADDTSKSGTQTSTVGIAQD